MKAIISKVKANKELLLSCFIMIWVGIACFFIQDVAFESNDDNSMARMAYGMVGYYETHLVFINVVIGICLKAFLSVFPNVPWYTIFQCGLVLVSFFVIVYLFLCRFGIKKGLLPCFLLIFFFAVQYFLNLQFSKTAGISSLAGLLLIFDAVKPKASGRIWKTILGIILAIAGSLYRFNVFGMTLIPMFGVGLTIVWEPLKQKNWKEILRICLPFVILIALAFIFKAYNTWSYQSSPQWAAYKEFNSLRANLLDYGFPDYAANQALYESLGISEADLAMFRNYDFADSEIFTVEALRQLVAAKPQEVISKQECVNQVIGFFFNYKYSVAVLIALAVAVVTVKKGKAFLLLYVPLATVGILVYLFYRGRYGFNRIDVSIACTLFVLFALYIWGDLVMPSRSIAGVLAALLILAPFSDYDYVTVKEDKPAYEPIPIYELLVSDQEHLYVRTVTTSIPRIPRPFEIYPVGYQSNNVALGGWGTNTATYLAVWEKYGVTNLFRDLVDNPKLYLTATKSSLKSRLAYINRHYSPEASAYLVKVTVDGYDIYRVSTTPGPTTIDTAGAVVGNGLETIRYAFNANVGKAKTVYTGYLYAEDENSFASSIYLGLTNSQGEETLYYTTQTYTDTLGDLMNGQYGAFSCELPNTEPTDHIKLYLETVSGLYCVDIGTVSDYIVVQE